MKGCDYYKPETTEEAMKMMGALDDARYIAGGTDVMVLIKQKKLSPANLISLRNIHGLSSINATNGLTIGSTVTHGKIAQNEFIQRHYSALADAAGKIGSAQVRNVATVGGNICNAAPSADTACPLLVFDAEVLIIGANGERRIPVGDFFLGPNRAALEKGEIVKGFVMPTPGGNVGSAYIKHTRRQAMELPILGIAARITVETAGRSADWKEAFRKLGSDSAILQAMEAERFVCADIRIAMSVVGPKPVRAKKAEAAVVGKVVSDRLFEEAGELAAAEAQPRDSVRGEAWYRKEMVQVLTRRAILISIGRIVNAE